MKKLVWLCALLAASDSGQSSPSGGTATSGPVPVTFFGAHLIHPASPWPVVDFGSRRFWDTGTRWAQLQSNASAIHPVWNWGALDRWLNEMKAHGLSDALFNLGGQTPDWLASAKDPKCDYNRGGCFPPADIAAHCTDNDKTRTCDGKADGKDLGWRQWVAAVSSHIANSGTGVHIAAYEVWNEFTRRANSGNQVYAWSGSNAQMVRLAEDARCIITGRGAITATGETCAQVLRGVGLASAVDPSSIMLSGSAGTRDAQRKNFYDYMNTPGASAATEAVAVHVYQPSAEKARDAFANFVAGLKPQDRTKPFWDTEGGYGTAKGLKDPDEQAAYVARYYLLLLDAGLVRVYWYCYDNAAWGSMWLKNGDNNHTGDDSHITCNEQNAPYGLGAGKGCLLPAGKAYQQVHKWLAGNSLTTRCAATGSVYTCGLSKPDGTQLLAVWDASKSCSHGTCTHSDYSPGSKYTAYYDLSGGAAHPVAGATIPIGAKPILLQSGGVAAPQP